MQARVLDAEALARLRQHVIIYHDISKQLWSIEVPSSQTRLQMRQLGPFSWEVVYSDLYPHAPLFDPMKELLIEVASSS